MSEPMTLDVDTFMYQQRQIECFAWFLLDLVPIILSSSMILVIKCRTLMWSVHGPPWLLVFQTR